MASVAKDILGLMRKDEKEKRVSVVGGGRRRAPKGVILYFEGLDCSGKSSTGGLVQAALEQAGYQVGMRQYNRPPTAEQRQDIGVFIPLCVLSSPEASALRSPLLTHIPSRAVATFLYHPTGRCTGWTDSRSRGRRRT